MNKTFAPNMWHVSTEPEYQPMAELALVLLLQQSTAVFVVGGEKNVIWMHLQCISDHRHAEGLEIFDWTLSRPYSSTAAENDFLGDGLIERSDRSKQRALNPEDATLLFRNRVPWHLGLSNGQTWARFPARGVRMSNPIQDTRRLLQHQRLRPKRRSGRPTWLDIEPSTSPLDN